MSQKAFFVHQRDAHACLGYTSKARLSQPVTLLFEFCRGFKPLCLSRTPTVLGGMAMSIAASHHPAHPHLFLEETVFLVSMPVQLSQLLQLLVELLPFAFHCISICLYHVQGEL